MIFEIVHEFHVRVPIVSHERHVAVSRIMVRPVQEFETEFFGVKVDRFGHVVDEDRRMQKSRHRFSYRAAIDQGFVIPVLPPAITLTGATSPLAPGAKTEIELFVPDCSTYRRPLR